MNEERADNRRADVIAELKNPSAGGFATKLRNLLVLRGIAELTYLHDKEVFRASLGDKGGLGHTKIGALNMLLKDLTEV